MNPGIYRKAALDRLSSPDDLDRMLTVTSARVWLVLTGLGIFVVTTLLWAFLARVPTKSFGSGILIGQGGVVNVVTNGTGVLTNFKLHVGDKVKAGDVVATIAQPDLVTGIRQATDRLAEFRLDATRSVNVQDQSTRLQIAALERQRATIAGDVAQGEQLVKLAAAQIPVEQHLLDRGLSTKQQVIAAEQKLVEAQAEVQKNKAQLVAVDAQRFALDAQPESTRRDSAEHVAELQRQLQSLQQQMRDSTRVVSPFSGEVVELKVYEGSSIVAGTPVLSLQPAIRELEIVAFVPTGEAKEIAPGMEAQVSPSTVKREEFGYLRGRVSYVSDFPTTTQAAMRTLENESLVGALKAGVVNEVRVTLEPSDNVTGYRWSSKRAPDKALSSGTLCTVQVVTEERRPIQLLMPFLKQFFTADGAQGAGATER